MAAGAVLLSGMQRPNVGDTLRSLRRHRPSLLQQRTTLRVVLQCLLALQLDSLTLKADVSLTH